MAYAHCHECDWTQDDFWDEGYNPIKSLQDWIPDLLDFEKLDQPFTDDPNFIRENGNLTRRQVIALELRKASKNILAMKLLTYKGAEGSACPNCGNGRVCID
jgi:hypothetical protein